MLLVFSSLLSVITIVAMPYSYAESALSKADTQPIPILQLIEYPNLPSPVKDLILKAFYLTKMNLTYLYGSADPIRQGMDCSGTIYYLLSQTKLHHLPRQANEIFTWVEKKGNLYKVTTRQFNSDEFSKMQPGDLLFWSGTYKVHRDPPITHVMLYLGKNSMGERLMFGASNGRTYQGKKMWGVSVFDFKLPTGKGPQQFVGYSCIPDLTCN